MMKKFFLLSCFLFLMFFARTGRSNGQDIKSAKEVFCVELKDFLNWSYDDKEEVLGWIGVGPDTDLKDIPKGKVEFCGVPFYIYSDEENNGKSIISVGYAYEIPLLNLPLRVGPIPVNKKADYLFFLHSSAWVRVGKGGTVGIYRIIYKDGTQEEIKLKREYEIEDWWYGSKKPQNAEIAWTKVFEKNKRKVGIFMYRWENPHPEKEIKEIVVEGNKNAQLFLFAITGIRK